jgi:TP901 family phage tail tape measure protein
MAEISQKLGFNAQQAIQELNRLQIALQNATTALSSFATAARSVKGTGSLSTGLNSVSKSAKTASTSLNSAGTSAKTAATQFTATGTAGKKAADGILLSWKSVGRIIGGQLLSRALFSLIGIFGKATTAAQEFGLQVAEIATIDSDLIGSQEQVNQKIRDLSVELGVAADVLAEGLYQTLSNQVVDAADSFEFLTTAANLARLTTADTSEAVNALSSVLNVYGDEAGSAAQISGDLFLVVEQGRLRLSQLGDTLGRVAPLAKQAGISWRELAASIDTITVQGVPVNQTITGLRAVINKLISPTDALREQFRKWNVEDGPAAIEKFGGLTNTLLALQQETGGNVAQMREFFGRIRATTTVLLALNGAGERTQRIMGLMEEAQARFQKELNEFRATPYFQAEQAAASFQSVLIELGDTILPIKTGLVELGAIGLSIFTKWVQYIRGLLEVFASLGSLIFSAGESIRNLSFEPLFDQAQTNFDRIRSSWRAFFGKELPEDSTEGVAKSTEEVENRYQEMLDQLLAGTETGTDAIAENWGEAIDSVSSRFEALGNFYNNVIDQIASKTDEALKPLTDFTSQFDSSIQSSTERVAKFQAELDQINFEESLSGKGAFQKFQAESSRAFNAFADAQRDAAQVGLDETKRAEVQKQLAQAETFTEQARKQAENLGLIQDEQRLSERLKQIKQTQINVEKEFINTAQNARAEAEQAENRIKAILEEQKRLVGEILDLRQQASNAPLFEQQQIADALEVAKQSLSELKLNLLPEDQNILEAVGVNQDTLNSLQQQLQDTIGNIQIDFSGPLNRAFEGLDTSTALEEILALPDATQEQLSNAVGSIDSISIGTENASLRAEAFKTTVSATVPVIDTINTSTQNVATSFTNVQTNALNAANSAGNLNSNTQSGIGLAAQLASAWLRVAAAAREAAAAAAAAAAAGANAYHGGVPEYLQAGGARGQDVVPAMLAPGEFVLNAKSSKKFASELNAMNAGSQPVYRDQGGSVTNVGDINITVQGGETTSGTVQAIGRGLRREILRGKLNSF